jgi:diketogulonate reductase-like aldo/keto reductase
METVTLNNGVKMPLVSYGVFQLSKEQTADLVFKAIKNGYRLIDTAQAYFNEEEVGQGIKKAEAELGVKRKDLFLTTKVWITGYGYDDPRHLAEVIGDTGDVD